MALGVVMAIFAAICTGGAAILQSTGAARIPRFRGVDPRMLLGIVRSRPYMAGIALDGASFALTIAALHTIPLFVVQAVGAASLAVVAVLSTTVLRKRLRRLEWVAVASVFVGVVMLVVSAHPTHVADLPWTGRWALLAAAVAIAVLAFVGPRKLGGAAFPGLLAGLTFGDSAVASRVISPLGRSATQLATSPLTYAVVLAGVLGTLLYATALQRGSVTSASGMSTLGQTLAPALVGLLLLGDQFRAGLGPLAGVGFACAVVGAVLLARHATMTHAHKRDAASADNHAGRTPGAGSGSAWTGASHGPD